jgi:hypothetical protein
MFISQSIWILPVDTSVELPKAGIFPLEVVYKFVYMSKMFISQSIWILPVDTSVELPKAGI